MKTNNIDALGFLQQAIFYCLCLDKKPTDTNLCHHVSIGQSSTKNAAIRNCLLFQPENLSVYLTTSIVLLFPLRDHGFTYRNRDVGTVRLSSNLKPS
ncbi:MAG: hypothetical protein AAFO69_21215, partial [Bacteroidota bacterium]